MTDELPSDALPSDIRALIDHDRRADVVVPEAARARILRKVGAAALVGSAATVAIGVGAKAAAGTGLAAFLGDLFSRKVSIVATAFFVGGAAGASGYAVVTKVVRVEAPAPTCPSVVATAPAPAPRPFVAAPRPPASASASVEPLASASATIAPLAPSLSSASPSADDAAKKRRLLVEAARAAIARGDAPSALEACDKYHAQGGGQLAEECELLAIRALAQLGRTAEAKTRAAAFAKRFPKSLYLPAIEQTLGSVP